MYLPLAGRFDSQSEQNVISVVGVPSNSLHKLILTTSSSINRNANTVNHQKQGAPNSRKEFGDLEAAYLVSEIPAVEKRHEMSSGESQVVVVPVDHSLGIAAQVQSPGQLYK